MTDNIQPGTTGAVAGAPQDGKADAVVMLSGTKFVAGCAIVAAGVLALSTVKPLPVWLLATEIFATIIGLFVFGSFKYQIHKNPLTFGMLLIVLATFFGVWWPQSGLKLKVAEQGWSAAGPLLQKYLLTWKGLDELVHADTMLFILGLTLFVAVIAQTRLLETITFALLRRNGGRVLPTVIAVTAAVGFASGILDGVSMIGLTIRTLMIVLMLAAVPVASIRFAVIVCTVVTTVCGMWLAYGEPPNLIMKANLVRPSGETYLTDSFFIRYCLPAAIASYLVVAWNLRRKLAGQQIELARLDVLDKNAAIVRFLQATRHGEVPTAIEFAEDHAGDFGAHLHPVIARLKRGEPFGEAMVRENMPPEARIGLLGKFVSEDLADALDRHYVLAVAGDTVGADKADDSVETAFRAVSPACVRAQRFGLAGLTVFVALLVGHAVNHHIPLFVASFAGFAVSIAGIFHREKIRKLALHEARVEFAEYYFLFPLFLSITLLTKVHFFDQLKVLLAAGIEQLGLATVALAQFFGCTVLSAVLDNNVVADFASRALLGLDLRILHLLALAQIAGYAVGGCWTHIGSAQSVVAFAFLRRDVDETYTPVQWIKDMTPIIVQIGIVLGVIIYIESLLLPR